MNTDIESRINNLHAHGLIDMHFDLLMDLYERRDQAHLLATDFYDDLTQGGMGVLAAAIFLESQFLPEMALRVALAQVARLYAEVEQDRRFAICKSYTDICQARANKQFAFLITMEGVEPIGTDLNMLRVFYELGVRAVGLTHARRNMAAEGGVFAASGSSPQGLTELGKDIVRECEQLGILVDLAHLNPAGTDDVLAMATRPLILSHTNPRAFYDIERNSTDAHIRAVAATGGVVGINSVLISSHADKATLNGFVDHIEHVIKLTSIDHVGIGFDFFHFIFKRWSQADQDRIQKSMTPIAFPQTLLHHGHARNVTCTLIERGFADADIEKILFGNWMRVIEQVLV